MHNHVPRTPGPGVVAAGGVAALLLLAPAGPAVADGLPSATAPVSASAPAPDSSSRPSDDGAPLADDPSSVADDIEAFYGGYIAALDAGDTNGAEQLRQRNTSTGYLQELERWEQRHQTDGVLRSQNVPDGVDVEYDGSGTGHTWTVVTLRWDGGPDTKLHVQADSEDHRISDIRSLS